MPELDFAGISATVEESVRQPEFADVEHRAGRVRLRRRVAVSTVAAVVVAAGAIGYAVRPNDRVALPPVAPRPVGDVLYVQAADTDHLYVATQRPCAQQPGGIVVADECRLHVYATDDQGRTWRPLTLPANADEYPINVLDARTVVAGRPADNGTQPYLSTDGGRTWRRVTEGASPVEAIPAGGAVAGCAGPQREPVPCRITVLDPASGQILPLAHQPPMTVLHPYGLRPEAGLWAALRDPTSGRPAVAWSRDGGRTWKAHTFAEAAAVPAGRPSYGDVLTVDGRVAYVVVPDADMRPDTYRTGDGGDSWQRLPVAEPTAVGPFGWQVVAADGALVVADPDNSGRYWARRDAGPWQPVTLTGLPALVGAPQPAGDGYVMTGGNADPKGIYVSDDGYAWRRIAVT